jgi:DNA polymerase
MPTLFHDFETRSTLDLTEVGAWRYTTDPTTDVWCCAFTVDDGPIQLWIPGDPVPAEFVEAARNREWLTSAFNDAFERLITRHIMGPRYGWPAVPLERRRCSQATALSLALPAKLESVARVLKLEHLKDESVRRVMQQMARPRKPRKGEDPAGVYWHDDPQRLEQLYAYCRNDVAVERDLHQRIGGLPPEEQEIWRLDATINERGMYIDGGLLDAAIRIAEAAPRELNAEIGQITEGALGTINQTDKLKAWLAERGCAVSNIQKGTLKHALRRKSLAPEARRALELRLDGAHAAANKLRAMRDWRNGDGRARGAFRYHGASTGRWTSLGIQVQNLKRPQTTDIGAAIEAVGTGNLEHLRERYPQPMSVVGDISRALICAAPGHRLIAADFSGIESRITAWLSGQQSKVEMWAKFDHTGDPEDEPYLIIGRRFGINDPERARTIGKTADLAFGYMGGVAAWKKLAGTDDTSSEAEIKQRQQAWRRAHPQTVKFWGAINRAAIRAVRKPNSVVQYGRVAFKCDGTFLRMRLPSGRKIAYPFPRLRVTKYGDPAVVFMDNQQGKWTECRFGHGAYGGIWTENAVSAVARDLLAAAMSRLEAAGYPITLHVHDELVAEVPDGCGSAEEFLRILTTAPSWADGLPIAAKVREGARFCKITKPEPKATAASDDAESPIGDGDGGDGDVDDDNASNVTLSVQRTIIDSTRTIEAIRPIHACAAPPISRTVTDGKIRCPFHDDKTPSCQLYADGHYHCFGCGAHGWIDDDLGIDDAVLPALPAGESPDDKEKNCARALRLWEQSVPIAGTTAARYLSDVRGVDLAALPANIDQALRFHPHCPFNGVRHPCLVALMRNATTNTPTGIQRIALTPEGRKIDRRMLGYAGAVKLWPIGTQLVVGEGLETVLAAATRIPYRDVALQPAWSLLSAPALERLPVLPGVERLIVLVDHDTTGKTAALTCAGRYQRAGRTVIRLTPIRKGADFNDLVMPEPVS